MTDRRISAIRLYVYGLCMGTADAVPGVSGGTIALIVGIYERLIDAIVSFNLANGRRLIGSLRPPITRSEFRAVLHELDLGFLLPLVSGIITAVVVVTRIVHFANKQYPVALFGFFFGLIAASAVVLSRQVSLSRPRHLIAALGGFLLAFTLSGGHTLFSGHSPALTVLAGMIAISAMILPGISGSLVLIIVGQYTYLSGVLSTFIDQILALATGGSIVPVLESSATVGLFIAGAVVGLATISRLVDRALERDRATTLAFLVSLVVGALRAPVAEISGREHLLWTTDTIALFVVIAVVGAMVLFSLDYYAVDLELSENELG